jgi:hypothetical protein
VVQYLQCAGVSFGGEESKGLGGNAIDNSEFASCFFYKYCDALGMVVAWQVTYLSRALDDAESTWVCVVAGRRSQILQLTGELATKETKEGLLLQEFSRCEFEGSIVASACNPMFQKRVAKEFNSLLYFGWVVGGNSEDCDEPVFLVKYDDMDAEEFTEEEVNAGIALATGEKLEDITRTLPPYLFHKDSFFVQVSSLFFTVLPCLYVTYLVLCLLPGHDENRDTSLKILAD